jgi:mannose-6-phosphate isomerase
MVQCRQIYVYSHATVVGWFDGADIVRMTLRALVKHYGQREASAPFVFSINRESAVVDARQDTYTYAFLIFACCWARKVLGPEVDRAIVERVLRHMENLLSTPDGLGFLCGAPALDGHLRQNPHMHLLEAALEVEDAFGGDLARPLIDKLFALFCDKLFLHEHKALPELHDHDWRPELAPGASFEPGHHFEWIWLLRRVGAATGRPVEALIEALAERAYAEGLDATGAVVERVAIVGTDRTTSRRCWGACEGLKAAASDFEFGVQPQRAAGRAAGFLRALRTEFLGRPFSAGWVDVVDGSGLPLVDYVPASTLYHVMLAAAEADRVFARVG